MPASLSNRQIAIDIFKHAIEAVQPKPLIQKNVGVANGILQIAGQYISLQKINHIYIVGAGKAAAPMAQALEEILGQLIHQGVIIVKYGHTAPLQHIATIEAAHPVPDENGIRGTIQLMQLLEAVQENDLVIVLISGGGSALLIDLPVNCTLQDLQQSFNLLLKSGATINEMNTVRKHLSQVKGGQLAKKVYPAKLFSLILSDVTGDPLDVIASGPTVADPTTFADAWQIIEKYHLTDKLPIPVRKHLQAGLEGEVADTSKPGDPIFRHVYNAIIGSNAIALEAASRKANELGFQTLIIGSTITGEARQVATELVRKAKQIAADTTQPKPVCLLMGGETTVTVNGSGLGGRNQELALAAALQLSKNENITILSGGTDGTDGPNDAAGAVVDGNTVMEARQKGLSASAFLENNDSYHFFAQAGGHIFTGPTLTNVMDIMLALVY